MAVDAGYVKKAALELGAELCGIAAADGFSGAPEGHHPHDLLPGCRSVIVLGSRFPLAAMDGGPEIYTLVRDQMTQVMNALSAALAVDLRSGGARTRVQRSLGCEWEASGRLRAPLSLKHAAVLAGLGKIGRNTLLVNDRLGNMVWLSAVLTDLELEADPPADYDPCPPGCRLCAKACRFHALDGEWMGQRACYDNGYRVEDGMETILCWACRKACPNFLGIKRPAAAKKAAGAA
jgi:epoxyqueuosine reductase